MGLDEGMEYTSYEWKRTIKEILLRSLTWGPQRIAARNDQTEVEHPRLAGHEFRQAMSSTSTIVIHAFSWFSPQSGSRASRKAGPTGWVKRIGVEDWTLLRIVHSLLECDRVPR